jgi:hypothetical protein
MLGHLYKVTAGFFFKQRTLKDFYLLQEKGEMPKCPTCQGTTKAGKKCKRRTCSDNKLCYSHKNQKKAGTKQKNYTIVSKGHMFNNREYAITSGGDILIRNIKSHAKHTWRVLSKKHRQNIANKIIDSVGNTEPFIPGLHSGPKKKKKKATPPFTVKKKKATPLFTGPGWDNSAWDTDDEDDVVPKTKNGRLGLKKKKATPLFTGPGWDNSAWDTDDDEEEEPDFT